MPNESTEPLNSQTNSSTGSSSAAFLTAEPWKPRFNPWLIAVVVSLAAFMEVLDTSIANVALPYMAGSLGASNDESISVDTYGRKYDGHVLNIAGASGARYSILPPENATGNYVKVVQRIPVKIVFEKGQDPEHLLRPGMSVEPSVEVR